MEIGHGVGLRTLDSDIERHGCVWWKEAATGVYRSDAGQQALNRRKVSRPTLKPKGVRSQVVWSDGVKCTANIGWQNEKTKSNYIA